MQQQSCQPISVLIAIGLWLLAPLMLAQMMPAPKETLLSAAKKVRNLTWNHPQITAPILVGGSDDLSAQNGTGGVGNCELVNVFL